MLNNSQQNCPYCGSPPPGEADDEVDLGSFRVLHLLEHVRREALGLEDYGEGEYRISEYCDVDAATTWPNAADQLRICIAGPIGNSLEAMCALTAALMRSGKLGPCRDDGTEKWATPSRVKSQMLCWLDEQFPPARAIPSPLNVDAIIGTPDGSRKSQSTL